MGKDRNKRSEKRKPNRVEGNPKPGSGRLRRGDGASSGPANVEEGTPSGNKGNGGGSRRSRENKANNRFANPNR